MISRRRFLEVGSVTAGMAVGPQSLVSAAMGKAADDASLPPSLAQLKSQKAKPRRSRARSAMNAKSAHAN